MLIQKFINGEIQMREMKLPAYYMDRHGEQYAILEDETIVAIFPGSNYAFIETFKPGTDLHSGKMDHVINQLPSTVDNMRRAIQKAANVMELITLNK